MSAGQGGPAGEDEAQRGAGAGSGAAPRRWGAPVGALVGLVLGLVFFTDEERSLVGAVVLSLLFAAVAGGIGHYASRAPRRT